VSENNNKEENNSIGGFATEAEYNSYVLNDGIWAKLDAKTNADVLDFFYTKARRKIRAHGGMLSTQDALELVMKEDREEMIRDIVQDLRKGGYYLIADAFQNESTRADAMRILELTIEEMKDPT
jgi:hypothetical protein